jgi:hypothetical protein
MTPLQINNDICSYTLGGIWLAIVAIVGCRYLEKHGYLEFAMQVMNAMTCLFAIAVIVVWLLTLK